MIRKRCYIDKMTSTAFHWSRSAETIYVRDFAFSFHVSQHQIWHTASHVSWRSYSKCIQNSISLVTLSVLKMCIVQDEILILITKYNKFWHWLRSEVSHPSVVYATVKTSKQFGLFAYHGLFFLIRFLEMRDWVFDSDLTRVDSSFN